MISLITHGLLISSYWSPILCWQKKALSLAYQEYDVHRENIAEDSRPRWQIMESLWPDHSTDQKISGHPRKNVYASARRINWFNPISWDIICEVASLPHLKVKMSLTEIVKELRRRSSRFSMISTQWLGRYIETRADGSRCWNAIALSRAHKAKTFSPAESTRRGILVG